MSRHTSASCEAPMRPSKCGRRSPAREAHRTPKRWTPSAGIERKVLWSWPLLQCQEIRDHVTELFTREPDRRRHRRLRAHIELSQIGFDERQQPLLLVDDLHCVGVFVQPAAPE